MSSQTPSTHPFKGARPSHVSVPSSQHNYSRPRTTNSLHPHISSHLPPSIFSQLQPLPYFLSKRDSRSSEALIKSTGASPSSAALRSDPCILLLHLFTPHPLLSVTSTPSTPSFLRSLYQLLSTTTEQLQVDPHSTRESTIPSTTDIINLSTKQNVDQGSAKPHGRANNHTPDHGYKQNARPGVAPQHSGGDL